MIPPASSTSAATSAATISGRRRDEPAVRRGGGGGGGPPVPVKPAAGVTDAGGDHPPLPFPGAPPLYGGGGRSGYGGSPGRLSVAGGSGATGVSTDPNGDVPNPPSGARPPIQPAPKAAAGASAPTGAASAGSAGGGGAAAGGGADGADPARASVGTGGADARAPPSTRASGAPSSAPTVAAPSATAYLGCASTSVGRLSAAVIICATSGIREEPPTSSTALRSVGSTRAERSVRVSAPIVDSIWARIMSSNSPRVRRTSKCRFGRNTGMDASVSIESASFAAMQSCRSRARAMPVCGLLRSSSLSAPPELKLMWARIASSKSTPPSRSMPSGLPRMSMPTARLRSTVASNVPPPRSYTATVSPSARWRDAA